METVKRRISYEKYFLGLLIASLFFISGMFIGNAIAEKKAEDLSIAQKAISAFLNVFELKEKASAEKIEYCNLSWSEIWQEKVEIGDILTSLELRLGKENEKVIEQKKVYNDVQFETLGIVNNITKRCSYNWTIILFFYTNDKEDKASDVKLGELQGYALDTIYSRNRENIKIFSFDVNVETNSTKFLINKYNISYTPALVIDDQVYRRFMSRYEIEQAIQSVEE